MYMIKAACSLLGLIYSGFKYGYSGGDHKRSFMEARGSLRCFTVDPRPTGRDHLNRARLQPKSGMVSEKPKLG